MNSVAFGQTGSTDRTSQFPVSTELTSRAEARNKRASPGQNAPAKQRRGRLVIAPLPISSPALGSGIVPVLLYIFSPLKQDDARSASIISAAGLATDNGSRALLLGGQFYFNDRYRLTAVFAAGNLNYTLYGLGSGSPDMPVPLKQEGNVFFGEILRGIGWHVFVGPRSFSGRSTITTRISPPATVPLPPDLGVRTALVSLGFRIIRDTRTNRFYPETGSVLDFTSDFYSPALGSKYSFESYKLTFNRYDMVGTNQVLAYNFFSCSTAGQPPFYGNCIYGANNELRGYIAGRYLDRYMLATQLEYRMMLFGRLGFVAFGGIGGVIPGVDQKTSTSRFLPSAGGGLRFELTKKYRVNLRIDIAQGKDGHTWSMGVGEAF